MLTSTYMRSTFNLIRSKKLFIFCFLSSWSLKLIFFFYEKKIILALWRNIGCLSGKSYKQGEIWRNVLMWRFFLFWQQNCFFFISKIKFFFKFLIIKHTNHTAIIIIRTINQQHINTNCHQSILFDRHHHHHQHTKI